MLRLTAALVALFCLAGGTTSSQTTAQEAKASFIFNGEPCGALCIVTTLQFVGPGASTAALENGSRDAAVEAGDSLAYISLQFYGRPSDYDRIFAANRSLLKFPDRIQIGQRLIIPG